MFQNVTVATPLDSLDLTVDPGPQVAGQNTTVVCKATGGAPSPNLEFVADPATFDFGTPVESVNGSVKTSTLVVAPGIMGMFKNHSFWTKN